MKYDSGYFEWQKGIGEFGAEVDFFKVADLFTNPNQSVLEFGCGGGFWLAKIKTLRVLGVEVNAIARENCDKIGIPVVPSISDVENDSFDICFSHHALEHVENPLGTLKEIKNKLKSNGVLRLITPFDTNERYSADDPNHHLYTWSVQNIGNLLKEAGFLIEEARYLYHNWPDNYVEEYMRNKDRFHKKAVKAARKKSIKQVIATARKNDSYN
jgi:SAM-dependent methyltransferase